MKSETRTRSEAALWTPEQEIALVSEEITLLQRSLAYSELFILSDKMQKERKRFSHLLSVRTMLPRRITEHFSHEPRFLNVNAVPIQSGQPSVHFEVIYNHTAQSPIHAKGDYRREVMVWEDQLGVSIEHDKTMILYHQRQHRNHTGVLSSIRDLVERIPLESQEDHLYIKETLNDFYSLHPARL